LKSPNVLVFDGYVARLADFGLSRSQALSMTMRTGTTRWTAPEVFRGSRYTTSADVYSFAVLCWELATLRLPFANTRFTHELEDRIVEGERLALPTNVPSPIRSLIADCWHHDPLARPSFARICARIEDIQLAFD
jgi:sterile alpha motif and leucine zipper containing kinase AZK